jgi:hypothetical protein
VDVARALLDRRHQHHVDEPHDRRLFALLGERLGADLLQFLEDFDVVGVSRDACSSSSRGSARRARSALKPAPPAAPCRFG